MRKLQLLLTIFVCLLAARIGQGQTTYGSIAGAVTDSSGAAVAGAQITLTNVGTSETRTQTTGGDGLYSFVNLIPGQYRVDIEKTGFKKFTHPDIAVEVNQNTKIDATLQVGELNQVVEVTAETPLIQAETSSLGTVVGTREANELPLNGRNIFNLTTITPSVVPQGNTEGTVVGKNPFDFANYQIGGSFANEGAIYLDGEPLNTGYINLPLLVPSQDSISEFKVQYNNLGPEWGRFAGGVINLSTRSGTNEWHGTLYEYLRNRVLNANEFFNKTAQLQAGLKNEPPPFTQNQFGGTASGPIVKNKTFFFFNYDAFRLREGVVYTTTVPTAAERTGNFSQTGLPTIYDPLSVNPNCPVGATCARTPFPGNIIPASRINPTAADLLSLYPLPTNPNVLTNNFTTAASGGGNTDDYTGRIDQNLTSTSQIFGRFTYWKLLSLPQDPFQTGLCKDRCQENTNSKSLALGYTNALSPTSTLSINASMGRFIYLRTPKNDDYDVTKEGWPAAYNGAVPTIERTPMTPCFAISDPLVGCSQGQSAISDYDTTYNLSPQLSLVRGRHNFVMGGQLEYIFDNYLQTNTGGGLISFNGSWTQSLARNATGATGGLDFADFLLGYGLGTGAAFGNQTTGSAVISQPVAGKETYRALYFADNWHVTNNLTLNLGLRYELQGPWSERYNRLTYFNPNVVNSSVTGCSGVPGSSCPGDLFLVQTGVNKSRNNLPLAKLNFSPRVGFAYAVGSKTVIRGGYGIFFIPNVVAFSVNPYGDVTASATSPFFASNNQGLTPSSTLNASNCTLTAPGAANFTCATVGPFGPTLVVPPGRSPQPNISVYGLQQQPLNSTGYTVQQSGYVQQWNLDIERQLPAGFFVDIAYAGSHGVHLPQYNTNIDQIPDAFINQAAQQYASGQPVTIAQKVATYPFSIALPGALGPGNLIQGQLDRPYPEYSGLNLNGYGCCYSEYNSLQATVTRRFGNGGTLLVAYTNAKLISNTDTLTSWLEGGTTGGVGSIQDWNNLSNERSLSSQNVAQRMVASYVLDLPIGKGKMWLGGVSGVADKLISGWGIDGTTTLQTGFPLKLSYAGGTPLSSLGLGIGTLRPNVVAGCDPSLSGSPSSRLLEWFNTSCFTAPPAYGFGDEARVDPTLRQDGVINFDFAAFKRTLITERLGIEFRAEFFNLFNRPQFGPPNTSLGSNTFGVVSSTVNNPRLIQFGLKMAF